MKPHRSITIIFSSIAATIFVACANPGQPSGSGTIGRPNSPTTTQQQGTGDGGGGNTCKGRPIESYAFDVMKSKAFLTHIAPAIAELTARQDDIFRLVTYAAFKKNWYVLPCELTQLSTEKIGSAVKTEQAAIQTFAEVWINEKIFNEMSEKDQADLIMHEMLMGFRLLKFDTAFSQCLAFAPRKDYCDQSSKQPRGRPQDLTDQDYHDIRRTTVEIFSFPPASTQDEWEDFFATRNFGNEFKFLQRKEDREQLTGDDFLRRLHEISLTGNLPSFGMSIEADSNVRKQETCATDIKVDYVTKTVDVKIKRSTGGEIHHISKVESTMQLHTQKIGARLLMSSFSLDSAAVSTGKIGERMPRVSFYFDGTSRLAVLAVTEAVCVSAELVAGESKCVSWNSPRDRLNYICSDTKSIER